MSLINKMLQDLDARGPQGKDPLQPEIKSVGRADPRLSLPVIAAAVVGAALIGVAGVAGWRFLQRPAAAPVVAVPAPAPAPVPVPVPATPPSAVIVAAPVAQPEPVAAPPAAERAKPRVAAPVRAEKPAPQNKVVAALPVPRPPGEPQAMRRRGAEDDYRRALAGLQDGRVAEAMSQLEEALRVDPRHEAARQTLVGLLVEERRTDEAMRLLQAGLALDVRQPALAMLLARLQIEGGGSGVETLQRTLPSAVGNADYHAFLAGALQRDQRHREAAEQYIAALRGSPENGVWLMGLGISLLADKRDADAAEAFQRARSSGNLPEALRGFVDRKLVQLGK